MLFHATHTHSYQTCHAHDEDRKAKVMEAISRQLTLALISLVYL